MIPPDTVITEVAANIDFGGTVLPMSGKDVVFTHAFMKVTVNPVGSSDTVVTIGVTFELKYSIQGDQPPTQKELAAFAGTNAVFHAWPYWREFVQSMFLRMNLPPVLLPVFRLDDHRKQISGTAAKTVPAPEGAPKTE
jgi:hypothetical protein